MRGADYSPSLFMFSDNKYVTDFNELGMQGSIAGLA